jgi:hypothetical protein
MMEDGGACLQAFEGAQFSAQGKDAMQIQERMFDRYLHGVTIKTISAGILACAFASMAFALIMFGPEGRHTEKVIFSVAFTLLSVGIVGFTQFTWRGVGLSFEAAQHAALGAGTQHAALGAGNTSGRRRRMPSSLAHTETAVGGQRRGNGVEASAE